MSQTSRYKLLALFIVAAVTWGCGLRPVPPAETPATREPSASTGSPTERQDSHPSGDVADSTSASSIVKVEQTPVVSSDVESLARHLTEPARTDRDRARALYRWLGENISYDVAALSQKDLPDQSAEAVFKRGTAVCGGYANLFQAMATVVGVESQVIPGRSPDPGLELATRFGPEESNHAWNAVKIDGEWQLLDCTWGAGHLDETRHFVREPNDDWFLVDPKVFIYSHFPEDPKWQLLQSPVSREEFDHMPLLSPQFFSLGFELLEPQQQPVASAGESVFRVASHQGNFVGGSIHAGGRALPDDFVLTQESNSEAEVRARFPQAGTYQMYIMARQPGQKIYKSVGRLEVKSNAGKDTRFPKTFGTFHEHHVRILSGTDRELSAGTNQRLSYQVDGVSELYLKDGEKQIPFEQHGNVYTLEHAPQAGEITVFAHFPGEQKLWALVSYLAR